MIFPEHSSPRKDVGPGPGYLSGLSDRRIAIVATGALGAMYLPAWLHWLRAAAPTVHTRTIITRSATGFVGLDALAAFSTVTPEIDEWGQSPRSPKHLDIDDDVHAYVVHPATMSFVSRLSAGLCDSPTMLAIQGTMSPVVVAASAPPGFIDGPVWRRYESDLSERPNIHLLPPNDGVSAKDQMRSGSPPRPFPAVMEYLDTLLRKDGDGH